MSRRKSPFTQFDLVRAIKGARAAGMEPTRVTITSEGNIELIFGEIIKDDDTNREIIL